jgi:hypothetical protein
MNQDLVHELKIVKLTKKFYNGNAKNKATWYKTMNKIRKIYNETMNKEKPDNWRIETPDMVPHITYKGEFIPMRNVVFLNIEEDIQGKDLVTFEYNKEIKQSFVTFKYIN